MGERQSIIELQMTPNELAAFILQIAAGKPVDFMKGLAGGSEYGERAGFVDQYDRPERASHAAAYGYPQQFHSGWAIGQGIAVVNREAQGRKLIRRGV